MPKMEDRNIDFVHFEDDETLEKFVEYIKSKNLSISHRCCNGKGIGIIKTTDLDVGDLKVQFINRPPENIELILTDLDICCVCKENTITALNCIKPHHICQGCVKQIKNECPYCRRKLT